MKERDVWSRHLRPLLHQPAAGRVCWKVQDAFRKGLPDLFGHVQGRVYVLEHKHVRKLPVREGSLIHIKVDRTQRAHLQEWGSSAGARILLTTEDPVWGVTAWLLPVSTPVKITRAQLEVCHPFRLTDRHHLEQLVKALGPRAQVSDRFPWRL